MSNPLSIAAVTATLRNLLQAAVNADPVLVGATITTTPPEKVVGGNNPPNQINVFLYHVVHSAAWRNQSMPGAVRSGEIGHPPLGLNLYYLISAYGQNNNDVLAHRLLGLAMSVLHDHALLGRAEIQSALAGNDLHEQIERARVTPQPLSIEEMYKLWSVFQAGYRISAAYEVAVTLIESARKAQAALPVLAMNFGGGGPPVEPDLVFPYPTITGVSPPNKQDGALLGDTLTFTGHDLAGGAVSVRFRHRLWTAPVTLPAAGSATSVTVAIPNDPLNWPAGIYQASVVVTSPGQVRVSNELAFALAPRITTITSTPIVGGSATVTLVFTPSVWPEQQGTLLIKGEAVPPTTLPSVKTQTLGFQVKDVVPGSYYIRLRVDGVDSLLIDHTGPAPVFKATQKVTLA
jgi:hypothetical protein